MAITINGSTGISGVNGSASTPALQGSDTNTGVYYGTDIISLSTNGTSRLYIDSSGNVGIGTATITSSDWSTGSRMLRISSPASSNYAVIKLDDVGSCPLYLSSGALTENIAYIWSGASTGLSLSTGLGTNLFEMQSTAGYFVASTSAGSGTKPAFFARAWVNFNGTGTVAIRASGNVSSITDLGVGNYYANLTTAMPDTSYCINTTANGVSITGETATGWVASATYFGIETYVGTTANDMAEVFASVFR